MLKASLALLVLVGCSKPDACEQAVERLARIAAKSGRTQSTADKKAGLVECRSEAGQWDPVLRCVLDEKSDAAASECIERGLAEVLKVNDGEKQGRGLNPLLEK